MPQLLQRRVTLSGLLLALAPLVGWAGAANGVRTAGDSALGLVAIGIGLALSGAVLARPEWLGAIGVTGVAIALLGALLAPGWLPWFLAAGAGSLVAVGVEIRRMRARQMSLEEERAALARQVDRRINEIFSLQELSYVLAESLQSERIATQVAKYVLRFLNADGAAVVLTTERSPLLVVAAAEGTLAGYVGQMISDAPATLVVRALSTERIEVAHEHDAEPTMLLPGHPIQTGSAAPLRAHGLTMGVLAVANRRQGSYSAEDLWLLSTVATHVAVVLANSRLFEMVRQAKEEWETAFNALEEGIAVLDGAGRVSRGNGALARLLDLPAPALLGRLFWSTVIGHPDGEEELLGASRRGERPPPLVIRSLTLDRVLRLTAAPVAEGTSHAAVVVLVEDVTEQRALEAQLIQSEKLAAVGQLVSGVAHELNNPLTSIAGLAEFLQERTGFGPAEREHLRVIHEQAERAGRIVRNLLTFARRGTPGEGTVDLQDVVSRTTLLIGYELQLRGIELVEERTPAPLPVRGNADELQQVALNLVANAVQAVRSLAPGLPRRVTVTTELRGNEAQVRVRDSGPGVPAELVPRLFTPFFTTKEPGEGTGLGLSLSFRIVEAHGGVLRHETPPGGGAAFWFGLPLSGGDAPAVPKPEEPAEGGRGSVLVVDGDPGTALVARALLEPAGYRVEVLPGAAEGLRRAEESRWSAILLDGALSADGRRLLAEQLAVLPGPRPRLLVSTADPAVMSRCRTAGVTLMPRPFLPRDLVEAAGDLLAPA